MELVRDLPRTYCALDRVLARVLALPSIQVVSPAFEQNMLFPFFVVKEQHATAEVLVLLNDSILTLSLWKN